MYSMTFIWYLKRFLFTRMCKKMSGLQIKLEKAFI